MVKRNFEISTLIVLILFFICSSVFAFPNSINYQGVLTDSYGDLLNGEYSLTFKIYGVETYGAPLWTEDQTVTVTDGIYNVELGAVTPFPANLFETERLYLEVIIFNIDTSTNETLSPRIPFNATGFSMKAKKVDSVDWTKVTGKPAGFADNTDNVNDTDADPGNEIQTLGTSGNNITLSNGGGSITPPFATYANNADMVDGKHASELINDADADPGNEIQTLGISGNNITLSNGGGSIIPPYAAYANNANMVDGKHAYELGNGDGYSLDAADGSPVDAVYVDNDGKVGIGMTNPINKLHVGGSLRVGWVTEDDGSTPGYGATLIFSGGDDWPTDSTPERDFDSDNSDLLAIARYNSGLDHSELRMILGDNANNPQYVDQFSIGSYDWEADPSPWIPRMTVLSTGNVGIGTTNPRARLEIVSTVIGDGGPHSIRLSRPNTAYKSAMEWYTGSTWDWGFGLDNDSTSQLYLWSPDAGYVQTWNKNGNVGIGTTTPGAKLDVNGNIFINNLDENNYLTIQKHAGRDQLINFRSITNNATTPHWNLGSNYNGVTGSFHISTFDGSNDFKRLTINNIGNVGIDTMYPSYKLHVNGTAYATGAAGALSDRRHKINISDLSYDALQVVNYLHPVTFEWKEPLDSGMEGTQLGFIAQEVEEVLPEVVLTQDNDEQTKGIKYSALIPLLTKAIQELEAQNEALKAENSSLRYEIEQIKEAIGL